ncbi:hypothetical protein IW262DRAFT_1408139 [Armillaria fumosa]|nr:hypothetical protein IW262DRAFT_1408139 [Armillaria fumosa]
MEPPRNLCMLFPVGSRPQALSQVATFSTEFRKASYRRPENECFCRMINFFFTHFCASSYKLPVWSPLMIWYFLLITSKQYPPATEGSVTVLVVEDNSACVLRTNLNQFLESMSKKHLGARLSKDSHRYRSFELIVTAEALTCLGRRSCFGLWV